jgi:hypothetical protein
MLALIAFLTDQHLTAGFFWKCFVDNCMLVNLSPTWTAKCALELKQSPVGPLDV